MEAPMEAPKGGAFFSARELHNLIPFHSTLRAAIELNVFDIIAGSRGGAPLTAGEIVSEIPTKNPNAAAVLDRILRTLAAYGILTTSSTLNGAASYGLSSDFRCLVSSEKSSSAGAGDGEGVISRSANVLGHALSSCFDSFSMMKHAVLEGDTVPFVKAFGVTPYEYNSKHPEVTEIFNDAMANNSKFYIAEVLKTYRGFGGVRELLDVGGGNGTLVSEVVKAYPSIRGLNFDLPYVLASAPKIPGVEHIAGDMFESVPNAETLMMKCVLYNWDDDTCKKLLANCWKALPETGKVIVMDYAIPDELRNDVGSRNATIMDVKMMVFQGPASKVRTAAELERLAKAVGFVETKVFPVAEGFHVLEFWKKGSGNGTCQ